MSILDDIVELATAGAVSVMQHVFELSICLEELRAAVPALTQRFVFYGIGEMGVPLFIMLFFGSYLSRQQDWSSVWRGPRSFRI